MSLSRSSATDASSSGFCLSFLRMSSLTVSLSVLPAFSMDSSKLLSEACAGGRITAKTAKSHRTADRRYAILVQCPSNPVGFSLVAAGICCVRNTRHILKYGCVFFLASARLALRDNPTLFHGQCTSCHFTLRSYVVIFGILTVRKHAFVGSNIFNRTVFVLNCQGFALS